MADWPPPATMTDPEEVRLATYYYGPKLDFDIYKLRSSPGFRVCCEGHHIEYFALFPTHDDLARWLYASGFNVE